MELFSGRFWSAVRELLDAGPVVLGTIPVPRYGRAIPQVHPCSYGRVPGRSLAETGQPF